MEKISATQIPPAYLDKAYNECRPLSSAPNLIRPFSVGYIKGYKRCSVMLVTLQGIKELGLADQISQHIRASWLEQANVCAMTAK